MKARHCPSTSGVLWIEATRCTTSAALTRALSVRNGIEPCPGVPRTTRVTQPRPFSPTMTGSSLSVAPGTGSDIPPVSVIT